MSLDSWRAAHLDDLLPDLGAVRELDHGTFVEIIWTGGNGPHVYRVHHSTAESFAVPPREFDPDSPLWFYNPILFVGTERFHTMVRVINPAAYPSGGSADG